MYALMQAELAETKQLAKQGQSLAKRVVVVCGGAHGLGPDIASRLVKEGAKVVVVDTNSASAKGKVRIRRIKEAAKTAAGGQTDCRYVLSLCDPCRSSGVIPYNTDSREFVVPVVELDKVVFVSLRKSWHSAWQTVSPRINDKGFSAWFSTFSLVPHKNTHVGVQERGTSTINQSVEALCVFLWAVFRERGAWARLWRKKNK